FSISRALSFPTRRSSVLLDSVLIEANDLTIYWNVGMPCDQGTSDSCSGNQLDRAQIDHLASRNDNIVKADRRETIAPNHNVINADRKSTRLNSSHVKISY